MHYTADQNCAEKSSEIIHLKLYPALTRPLIPCESCILVNSVRPDVEFSVHLINMMSLCINMY